MSNIESVKGHLIVSCQALPDEPLHSSFIMGRMARAAKWGGAKGIRANTVEDINEIQKEVDLPVIGIIKRVYGDCPVFITPTMKEIDELIECSQRRREYYKKAIEPIMHILVNDIVAYGLVYMFT